jgi:hypothetical protein
MTASTNSSGSESAARLADDVDGTSADDTTAALS